MIRPRPRRDSNYPPGVVITPAALTVSMDTQIALGNLAAQPVYEKLIATSMAQKAMAIK